MKWVFQAAVALVVTCQAASGGIMVVAQQSKAPNPLTIKKYCVIFENERKDSPSQEFARIITGAIDDCKRYQSNGDAAEWQERARLLKIQLKNKHLLPKELQDLPDALILPDSFEAYALFLFPDPYWRTNPNIPMLKDSFRIFGDAIGDRRAAVWFSDEDDQVDYQQARDVCNILALSYVDGPYIVVSHVPPALLSKNADAVVLKLSGVSPARLPGILSAVENSLRSKLRLQKRPLLYAEVKAWLLSQAESQGTTPWGMVITTLKSLGSAK